MPSPDDPLAPYEPAFQAAGQAWNIDPLLLKAIAMQESSGKPGAVSKAGAQGLMQIMPDTQQALGMKNPWDPVESIWAAAKYLNEGFDKEGSIEGALLYYHGGSGWRQAYGKESQGYVPAVAGRFQALLKASQPAPAQTASAPPTGP